MSEDGIQAAFELLMDELDRTVEMLNQKGAQAFREGRHEQAERLLQQVKKYKDALEQVETIYQYCLDIEGMAPKRVRRQRKGNRLLRGVRTPEGEFRLPILEALVEMGGRGHVGQVLDRVEEKMKGRLKPVDYETLPSDARQVRWRNTAQWARNAMVEEGLLSAESPKGVWEITAAGRERVTLAAGQRPLSSSTQGQKTQGDAGDG